MTKNLNPCEKLLISISSYFTSHSFVDIDFISFFLSFRLGCYPDGISKKHSIFIRSFIRDQSQSSCQVYDMNRNELARNVKVGGILILHFTKNVKFTIILRWAYSVSKVCFMSHISHIGSSTDFRFLHLGSPSCEEAIAYINVCMKRIEEVEGNASQ